MARHTRPTAAKREREKNLNERRQQKAARRQDVKQQQGKSFSLRAFHDTLLGQGTAPFWLHRQLMLGDDGGDLLE